jgi:hypothetical protein
MNNESTYYIVKALAAMLDVNSDQLKMLEAEIGQMGQNQRADLLNDFQTIVAGIGRLTSRLADDNG